MEGNNTTNDELENLQVLASIAHFRGVLSVLAPKLFIEEQEGRLDLIAIYMMSKITEEWTQRPLTEIAFQSANMGMLAKMSQVNMLSDTCIEEGRTALQDVREEGLVTRRQLRKIESYIMRSFPDYLAGLSIPDDDVSIDLPD